MSISEEVDYILPECDFYNLDTGVQDSNECSPELKDVFSEFLGIAINGPKVMVWPVGASPEPEGPFGNTHGDARLMIASYYKLPRKVLGLDNTYGTRILFVAVNQKTNEVYSGKIPMFGDIVHNKNIKPEDYDKPTGGWVNADLVNIAGIPISDATYTVYATLGEYKSNVLTIKTEVK